MNFHTLHIFNFGKAQLIGEDFNKTVDLSELTDGQEFLDSVLDQKPQDFVNEKFHVLNVFNTLKAVYISTSDELDATHFSVGWADLDLNLLQSVVDQILSIQE
jgi:hypothetical protein